MDRDKVIIDRFIQAISLHGPQLVNDAKNAHGDVDGSTMDFLMPSQSNIDSTNYFNHRLHQVLYPEYPVESRMEPDFQERIRKFIASKSDLLFSLKGREELRRGIDYGLDNNHEVLDLYSKVPPLEVFMGIPTHVKRWHLFKVMKEDDIVLGEVVSKRPFGIFVKLTALEFSKNRDFTDTNIEALCRTLDLDDKDTHREHKDPADGFLIGDHVRGKIALTTICLEGKPTYLIPWYFNMLSKMYKDDLSSGVITSVNIEEERIAISFKSSKLPEQHQHLHLGLLEDFDNTKESHYDSSESKSYMEHLSSQVGLNNPKNIETLIDILGVDTQQPCSLLRSFQRCNYPEEEFFDVLRKKQSAKWSMESTAKGIELFKAGDINTALKYLEHALQIHGENTEALVARGALTANEGKYSTAVNDFRQALSINQNHKNATKYLVQTLIEQGIQQEKNGQLTEASHSLSEAIALNPDQPTAKEHLEKIKEKLSIKRQEEKSRQKDESSTSKFSYVRQLIEEEQIRKKKKKKKDKKKRKKQRVEKKNKKTRRRTRTRSDTDNSLTSSESPYESENKNNSKNKEGESDRVKMQTNQRNEKELCESISHSTISDEKDSQSRKRSKDAMTSRVHQRKRSRSTTSTGSNYSGNDFSDNRSTDEGQRRQRDHSRSRKLSHRDKRSRSSSTRSSRSRSSSSDKGTSNRSKRRSREKARSRKLSHRDKRSSRSRSTVRSRSSSYKRTSNRSKRRSREKIRSRKLSHRDKRSCSTSTGSTRSRSSSSDKISANRSKRSRKQFHSSIK